MESHGLKYENVKLHKGILEEEVQYFVESKNNPAKKEYNIGPFKPLIEWGIAFGTAAEIELRKEALAEEIATLQKEKAACELAIRRNDAISADITAENMAEYYESQVKSLCERKTKIEFVANQDQQQAQEYQKKLHGFDKLYFDKLLAAVKDQN